MEYELIAMDVKSVDVNNDQSEYWKYIKPCVDRYNMRSAKTVPAPIIEFFSK